MKVVGQIIGAFVLTLAVLMGLGWLAVGNEFFLYKFFAPRREAVRREVFENTKSYRQGMIQELSNMQREYVLATPHQQAALRSIILHRAADVPSDTLTPDLNRFLSTLRSEVR